jgi:hypothetical protein
MRSILLQTPEPLLDKKEPLCPAPLSKRTHTPTAVAPKEPKTLEFYRILQKTGRFTEVGRLVHSAAIRTPNITSKTP